MRKQRRQLSRRVERGNAVNLRLDRGEAQLVDRGHVHAARVLIANLLLVCRARRQWFRSRVENLLEMQPVQLEEFSEAAIRGLIRRKRVALKPLIATEAVEVVAGGHSGVDQRGIEDAQLVRGRRSRGCSALAKKVGGGQGRDRGNGTAAEGMHAATLPDLRLRPGEPAQWPPCWPITMEWVNDLFLRSKQVPQRTFSIIKPDAVGKGYIGAILAEIDKAGFRIIAVKKQAISKAQAEGFYYVHKERPFFGELCTFMSSGPLVLLVLEKDNAILDLRKLMGATNPANAEEGTIRKKFAGSIQENAIHGSDGEDTAAFEIGYWFAGYELI